MKIPNVGRLIGLAMPTLMAGLMAAATCARGAPPVAPIRPVTDDYFGTAVVDNYRYMENLDDPEMRGWMKAQADYTRAQLDALPGRTALLERIHALSNADLSRGRFARRGERYFYLESQPGAAVPKLYFRDGLQGEEHLLVDPAELGKGSKTHYSLDYFTPSRDGRYLAYGVSPGGSEDSVLHVLDVASGQELGEAINRTSGSVVAWRPDNHSFFYLRYLPITPQTTSAERLYNARTYWHTLGTRLNGDGDPAVFGRGVSKSVDVPEGQGTYVVLAPGSATAFAVADHNMDRNTRTLYVAPLAEVTGNRSPWHKFADVSDGVEDFGVHGDTLYFLSRKEASRFRLLSTSASHPDLAHARVVVPEGHGVLTGFALAKEGLYVRERDGAVSRLWRVSFDGAQRQAVDLPFEGSISGLTTDPLAAGALFDLQGWVRSPRALVYDPDTGTVSDSGLIPPSSVDVSQLESKEVFAVSYDGTRIPLSIIYPKGLKLDGSHPTVLTGYGSYGNSSDPYFSPVRPAWTERNGILAVAHLRGGGEYGEDWHRAGQLLTKINTILDLIACAQYLVDEHYTSPKYLAAEGGSAGGIPVGGALTWRPELFAVILDLVGMSDTLRAETAANGPPNILEFGSVKTEQGFHGLYAMSAYLHVRDGTAYPATLFVTGANDPRVPPWHMAKMAARVQAANSGNKPILLRVDYDAGHGIGSTRSQREALQADLWSFALWQMGDAAFQPAADH